MPHWPPNNNNIATNKQTREKEKSPKKTCPLFEKSFLNKYEGRGSGALEEKTKQTTSKDAHTRTRNYII